ncbi:MAG: N-acetylmuramoyl-L-alanine amidase [Lachnospiraceae bacterium]|nr:N-acetylmuramoyl-L-alanine amidase [Lachnospiraceae bacterium]
MRFMKRLTALCLAILLGINTGGLEVAAAEPAAVCEIHTQAVGSEEKTKIEESIETAENIETAESTETVESIETAESTETVESIETAEGTEAVESIETAEGTETVGSIETAESTEAVESIETVENTETVEDTEAADSAEAVESEEGTAPQTTAVVNFLVIDEPMVTTPGTQRIMTSIGDGTQKLEEVVLTYIHTATGQEFKIPATEILGDFVLFEITYTKESLNGTYHLEQISYLSDGQQIVTDYAQIGIDAAFGVNEAVETTPDDVLLREDANSTALIQEALANAGCEVEAAAAPSYMTRRGSAVSATGLVVVLDPGHGGNDGGAQGNGITEKTVNLKIAKYCKAELEEYAGVTVYMTRESDTYLTLAERAQVAINKKADLFVGLHNNSNKSSAVSGANVYYPNANYNATCSTVGKSIASIIESKLTDLGLASGGIHYENSKDGTKYPNGSTADYYGVIKRCKENGIPAILVEHAFVSNAGDAKNYLSTDEQLKKLGVADAAGIAEYYGLSKGIGFTSIVSKNSTTIQLNWKQQAGVSGYCIYKSSSSTGEFTKVATIESASTTSWKDTGLAPGTVCYYKIRSFTKTNSGKKYSEYSPAVAGLTMECPEISMLKSQSNKAMVIGWDILSNVSGYEVYRATSEKGTYKCLATLDGTTTTTYTDTTVKAGKLYYYKIRAWGKNGNTMIYSDYSAPVYGRTAKTPGKPTVKSQDSNTLRISWKAVENVSGYVIQRASSKAGKYKKIATITDAQTTSYDDTTVKTGKTYYYRIRSYNYNYEVKGYSGYSKVASQKTVKKTVITQMVSDAPTKITLRWKKADGVNGYVIYRSTTKDGVYTKIKTIKSANRLFYTDTKLTPGTKYYYKVRTRTKKNGKIGYGSDSVVRSTWTGKKPVVTEALGTTATKIRITWDEIKGAQSYNIYRSTKQKNGYKKIASVLVKNGTSYEDSKLDMTQKYYYKVEAVMKGYKATGTSGKSAALGGTPIQTGAITSVATNENNQLQIKWQQIKNVTGYRLYRSTQENGNYTILATISDEKTTSYVDTGAYVGTTYYYKLVLMNTYDKKAVYGPYSAAVSGVLLMAPNDITVISASENQLNLTWSAAAGAAGYEIYRSTDYAGEYTLVGTVTSGAVTSYSDTTVTKDITYYYKIRTVGKNNTYSNFGSTVTGCAVAKPAIESVALSADKKSMQIVWKPTAAEITGYEVYKSTYLTPAKQIKVADTTEVNYVDTNIDALQVYYYRVRAYTKVTVGGKTKTVYGTFSDTVSTNASDCKIMGASGVTAAQMAAMYKASGNTYPSEIYKNKGAADIDSFCQIVYEECCIEGVKPEVIFAQICHETGYLQFGGQVKAAQCNFGGLGATDDGASGGAFTDVRMGVRTQVQHMKAYASTAPLKQACIDGRFSYVNRGSAEYVQQLGKGNWATDTSYDVKVLNVINKILVKQG